MQIRNELKSDFREVEELTRKAFWNLQVPGCNEHYLVHVLRNHEDFIPELELGYDTIVIFGNPENYISSGFRSSRHYNISIGDKAFPTALLVKELCAGAVPDGSWSFLESEAYKVDDQEAEAFDKNFEPLVKEYKQTQELFYIYSHSRVF